MPVHIMTMYMVPEMTLLYRQRAVWQDKPPPSIARLLPSMVGIKLQGPSLEARRQDGGHLAHQKHLRHPKYKHQLS